MKEIDFHAHILPICDHGSDGKDTSLKQLSSAASAGVDVICATPHFYPEKEDIEAFLSRRERCYTALMQATELSDINTPQILLGAEVLCFAGMEKLSGLEKLCIRDSRVLLLEMPFQNWNYNLIGSVEKLAARDDISIVLAHVDRYPRDDVADLLSLGLSAQLNVSSCCGIFWDKAIEKLAENGCAVAWGSDIHGTDIGYKHWEKCKRRRQKYWDRVMSKTNVLLGF